MTTAIRAERLSFRYGSQLVLDEISFSLQAGMFCCLLGRNGAGKSTLIRCLLGLDRDYQGTVFVHENKQEEYSQRQLAQHLAYIPQIVDCVYEYTVEQFVLMGRAAHLGVFQGPSTKDKSIANQALEKLGIAALAKRSMTNISGGERQLTAIARALAQQSTILVMDEPTSSLDYGNQVRFMVLARELARQGYLILMSCHNPHQARQFADSVIVLENGKISAAGVAEELMTSELISGIYGLEMEEVRC